MKKDYFILELIKSPPFLLFIIIALLIVLGIILTNHHENVVKMKENVLYVAPTPTE